MTTSKTKRYIAIPGVGDQETAEGLARQYPFMGHVSSRLRPEQGVTWKLVRLLFYPSAFLLFDIVAMIAGLAVTVSRQVEYWRRKQKVLQPSSTPWEVFLAVCLTFIVVNVLFAAAIIGAMEPAGGEKAEWTGPARGAWMKIVF